MRMVLNEKWIKCCSANITLKILHMTLVFLLEWIMRKGLLFLEANMNKFKRSVHWCSINFVGLQIWLRNWFYIFVHAQILACSSTHPTLNPAYESPRVRVCSGISFLFLLRSLFLTHTFVLFYHLEKRNEIMLLLTKVFFYVCLRYSWLYCCCSCCSPPTCTTYSRYSRFYFTSTKPTISASLKQMFLYLGRKLYTIFNVNKER